MRPATRSIDQIGTKPHRFRNRYEIGFCNLQNAKPKRVCPVRFVFDETQSVDERPDRRVMSRIEVDAATRRNEAISHVKRIVLTTFYASNLGKRLYRFSTLNLRS